MEITELNLIGDFEVGIKCLQNPSLLSKLSLVDTVPQLYSFWTFGALVLAVFATFTNIFNRIKLFLHVIRDKLLSSYQKSCPQQIFDHGDFDFSDDDGDDNTPSSVAESDNEEEFDSEGDRDNDVFRIWGNSEGQNGSFGLRQSNGFSWSDFSVGKSVVQLWDSFGLGLDFEDDEFDKRSEIEIWDFNRDVKLSSGRRFEVASATENILLTAEMNFSNDRVGFGTYDSRVDGKPTEIYATWQPLRQNIWFDGDGGGAGQKEE